MYVFSGGGGRDVIDPEILQEWSIFTFRDLCGFFLLQISLLTWLKYKYWVEDTLSAFK